MWFENDTGKIEREKVAMVWSCEKGNGGRSVEIGRMEVSGKGKLGKI